MFCYDLGISTHGLETSSANNDLNSERLSQFDSRLRVCVARQTPGLSEGLSDIDGLSTQLDIYDDVVEGINCVN